MNLQRERDILHDIILSMKSSSNPAVDRDTLVEFAEQVLIVTDAILYALNELSD